MYSYIKIIRFLSLILIIVSCGQNTESLHPEIMKPDWTDIDSDKLKIKIGDIVSIKTNTKILYGIVLDINKDEMGIWYGICLSKAKIEKSTLKNSLFFGRQIPNGFTNASCINCFDLTFLNEKGVNQNLSVLQNLKLNRDNISIGAIGAAIDISEVENAYELGIENRLKKPTECGEKVLSTDRVDERYMRLDRIL